MFKVISHTIKDSYSDDLIEHTMESLINTDFIVSISYTPCTFTLEMMGGSKYYLSSDQANELVKSLGLEERVTLSRVTKAERWVDGEYVMLTHEQIQAEYGLPSGEASF